MKNMNLKTISLLAIFIGSYYFLHSLATTQNIANSNQEITTQSIQPNLISKFTLDSLQTHISQETYLTLFQEEETKVWQEFKKTIDISLAECNQIKQKWYSYYLNDAKELQERGKSLTPLSAKTIEIIQSVMKDFNIDQNAIAVIPFEDYCPAAADDYSLFVNESLFNRLTPLAQKFCIAHELQHFINKDDSTNYVLLQHYTEEKSELPADHPLNKLSKIQELRADLGAASKNKDYALGYKEFSKIALEIVGDGEGITHPKNTLRISYADLCIKSEIA